MKSSKVVPVSHRKRKLSTASIDGMYSQVSTVTRRTRSSSNADNIYTQRSTRSTQNNAFFELPNNYGSRKHHIELNDSNPIKKVKRSSTSSSSANNTSSEAEVSSPPLSKRKKLQSSPRLQFSSSTVSEKENLELFNNQSNEQEDIEKEINGCFVPSNKCLCPNSDSTSLNASSDSVDESLPKSSSEKIIRNGHDNPTNNDALLKKEITQSSSVSNKYNMQELEKTESKSNNSFPGCLNNTELLQKNSELGILRKRHFSENETFSTRRVRRLSERGEMASIMEFFFNHKKPCTSVVSSAVKKSKQIHKRNLRNSTLIQSPGSELSENGDDINEEQLNCNGLNHLKHNRKLQNGRMSRNLSPLSDTTPTKHQKRTCQNLAKSTDVDKNLSTKNDKCAFARQRVQSDDAKSFAKHENSRDLINPDIYFSLNGVDNEKVVDDIMEEITDIQLMKFKKRSLRSSGAISKPDYYALGLDLMIHRRRKNKSKAAHLCNSDLQVMSDSEIDLSKKSSIESCISCQEKSSNVDERLTKLENNDNASAKTESASQSFDIPSLDESLSSNKSVPSSSCRRGRGRGRGRPQRPVKVQETLSKPLKLPEKDLYDPPPLFEEEPPIGPDVYYFESDHVALKHNTDYYAMLRSASILEAQRKQALKDLEILQQKLKDALKNPISFVDNLQKKRDIGLPRDQTVSPLPDIDWSKYTSPFGTFENVFSTGTLRLPSKPFTRQKKSIFSATSSTSGQATNKIRSDTFKKSWTVEEQRKLEELLIKYPQEAVEFNRFRKIASELGNRTPLQVQSRVQKYFIKLAKAGLPIPGRMPRLDRMFSCKRTSQRHRTHHQASLTRISTFFSNFHIPVKMNDDDDLGVGSLGGANEEDDGGWDAMNLEQVSDEEDIPDELRFSDEYLEILQLKRQRKQQLRMFDKNGRQMLARHHGYQCDLCQSCPIEGVRFHCIDCPESESVDLCQSCIRMQNKFETDLHKSNHRLEPVYASVDFDDTSSTPTGASDQRPFADVDYTKVASSRGEYNYLDPNFLPPSG